MRHAMDAARCTAQIGERLVVAAEGLRLALLDIIARRRGGAAVTEDLTDRLNVGRVGVEVKLAGQLAEEVGMHLDAGLLLDEPGDGLGEGDGAAAPSRSVGEQVGRARRADAMAIGLEVIVQQDAAAGRQLHLEGGIGLGLVLRNVNMAGALASAPELEDVTLGLERGEIADAHRRDDQEFGGKRQHGAASFRRRPGRFALDLAHHLGRQI